MKMKLQVREFAVYAVAFMVTGLFLVCTGNAYGQSRHLTSSGMALGGGGTAFVDGYHANFVNPANLLLNKDQPRRTVGLFGGVSTTGGGSLVNIGVYNEYFTAGRSITGTTADEMMDRWFGADPANMRNAGMNVDVVPVGFSIRGDRRAISLALRNRVLIDTKISRGLAELGVYGMDSRIFGEGRPVNFGVGSMSFSEVSLGYSRKLLEIPGLFGLLEDIRIYAGAAPKLLVGVHSNRLDFNSTFTLEGEDGQTVDLIRHDFAYTVETTGSLSEQLRDFYDDRQQSDEAPSIGDYLRPEAEDFYRPGGFGAGLDLGATAEMQINLPVLGSFFRGPEILRVGLSLTDLGTVTYSDRAGRFSADDVIEWRGFELDQERIDEEFNGDRDEYFRHVMVDSIATEIYGSFAPEEAGRIHKPLPSMINLGGQLVLSRLSVSVDLGKGFANYATNSRRISLSAGVEYDLLGVIPLRAGLRTGGYSSTSYSAGAGIELKNFEFSIAASSVASSSNYGSNAGVAISGLVIRF